MFSLSKYSGWFLYIVTILFCFLFFSHTDPIYTISASFSYLTGHISDFYDFNSKAIGEVVYLPSVYGLIAVWFLPFKWLSGLNFTDLQAFLSDTPMNQLQGYTYASILIWYKLLLVFLSYLTFRLLQKISKLIPKNTIRNELALITSPFAIFSVLIFSGYDIFGVFFTILGLYYYLKKDLIKFAAALSFAISCKFFAVIIFIPLLLLVEKNILRIIQFSFPAISLCAIYFLFYMSNELFVDNVLLIAKQKSSSDSLISMKHLCGLIYLGVCFYAYQTKKMTYSLFVKRAIFISYISYLLMFFAVKWHPNWILIIIPFMALSYSYIKSYAWVFWLEFFGFISFIVLISNIWMDNVDQIMFIHGPLSQLIGKTYFFHIADVLNMHSLDALGIHLKPFLLLAFYAYLAHPLLILFREFYAKKKN